MLFFTEAILLYEIKRCAMQNQGITLIISTVTDTTNGGGIVNVLSK